MKFNIKNGGYEVKQLEKNNGYVIKCNKSYNLSKGENEYEKKNL